MLCNQTNQSSDSTVPAAATPSVLEVCPICRNSYKLPLTLSCGHRYCFFCIKNAYAVSKSCPTCRKDVPVKEIERPVIHTNDVFSSKWLYQGRDGRKWWRYDEETSKLIEEQYQRYIQDEDGDIDVKFYIGNTEYEINFGSMEQYRTDAPLCSRKIRRIEPASESMNGLMGGDTVSEDLINGIAGIKVVKVPPPRVDDDEIEVAD